MNVCRLEKAGLTRSWNTVQRWKTQLCHVLAADCLMHIHENELHRQKLLNCRRNCLQLLLRYYCYMLFLVELILQLLMLDRQEQKQTQQQWQLLWTGDRPSGKRTQRTRPVIFSATKSHSEKLANWSFANLDLPSSAPKRNIDIRT